MKVLMLSWEYPPLKVGGIAVHVRDLSKALVERGHEVHILTQGEANVDEVLDGVNVHRVKTIYGPDTISWSLGLGHFMEKRAVELFRDEPFDVVHAHDWMMAVPGRSVKNVFRKPLVFTVHSTEQGRVGVHDTNSSFINNLEWYGTFLSDQVITVGRDIRNELKWHFNVPESKLNYVPNGVDYKKFSTKVKGFERWRYASDWENFLLFVGRLYSQKGVEHLLYALPSLLKKHSASKLILAGGGAVDHYRGIAHALGVGDKTFFLGHVNNDDHLIGLYQNCDAVVAPSVYEPFGIVALEAQSAGKPIVASYTGGFKDTVIHEHTGLHCWPAHAQSAADQTARLLANLDWSKQLGKNGKKRAEKVFSWSKTAKKTELIYESCFEQ
jgi:glycosyltransferase involved in cell wall biosynthesis